MENINDHVAKAASRIKKVGLKPPFSSITKKDRVEITCQRSFVTVTILKGPNKTVYTGTAKVCPGDEPNDDIGIAIATKRALLSRNDLDVSYDLKKIDDAVNKSKIEVPYGFFKEICSIVRAHAYGRHYNRDHARSIHEICCGASNDHINSFAKKYHKGSYVKG